MNAQTMQPGGLAEWRWAPAWVLTFVALWPARGIAEAVLVLGALAGLVRLVGSRFRGGGALLSGPAWALTSVLFAAYWLPELIAAIDARDRLHAFGEVLTDLRYLPFLWVAAAAVASEAGRRRTFGGLAVIALAWTLDALVEAATGTSPLFWLLDQAKHVVSGHGMCTAGEAEAADRLAGVLGPCNLKLGIVLASLSPFALWVAGRRHGAVAWLAMALAVGVVILLAGARAAWVTYALVLLCSGWQRFGARRTLLLAAAGALAATALALASPQMQQRLERTAQGLSGDAAGLDAALSGRMRIWQASLCMVREHPLNGVGVRGFRVAWPACDPAAEQAPAWGAGGAFHAHQLLLEILAETGILGLLLWLAGAATAWRAWRRSAPAQREQAHPAMLALGLTLFPFNTHLAVYSTFWGGVVLLLAGLYAGSLLGPRHAPLRDAR